MGRLRAHYRRLSEDSPPPLPPEYLSYCCCRCGHTQMLKAEELHAAVGQAFRMAYAAQLHKRRDVPPPPHHWDGTAAAVGVPTGATSPAGSSSEGSGCASPTAAHAHRRKGGGVPGLGLGLGGYVNEAAKALPPPALRVFHLAGSRSSQSSEEEPRRCVSVGSELPLLEGVAPAPASTPPPPPPERSDSLGTRSEAHHLRAAPWFQAGIPREIALEVLGREPEGAFMVRESTSKPGCYALSLRVPRDFQPSGIAHYLILRTAKGYKIKGFTKEFSSLTALITHHSVMPELLPVPLSLSRYNPSFPKSDSKDSDSDPDYNTLADFRKMMADLNV
ncbi:EGFR adapter protein-like [Schistocerca gregaria]|uniref:EGFR adapter protein-like n=1 Tax=Schistocerca gregaria TaxID=7010 RepID=UPI00211DD804|nr:EGFR adapter protein-like [Schistocerca gregaria]